MVIWSQMSMGSLVTNDLLHIDKALGILKSDNKMQKNNFCSD